MEAGRGRRVRRAAGGLQRRGSDRRLSIDRPLRRSSIRTRQDPVELDPARQDAAADAETQGAPASDRAGDQKPPRRDERAGPARSGGRHERRSAGCGGRTRAGSGRRRRSAGQSVSQPRARRPRIGQQGRQPIDVRPHQDDRIAGPVVRLAHASLCSLCGDDRRTTDPARRAKARAPARRRGHDDAGRAVGRQPALGIASVVATSSRGGQQGTGGRRSCGLRFAGPGHALRAEDRAWQLVRALPRGWSDHRRRDRRSVVGSRTVGDERPGQRSVPRFVSRRHGGGPPEHGRAVSGPWRPDEQSPLVQSCRFPAPDQRLHKTAEPSCGSPGIRAVAEAQMPRIITVLGRRPESRLVGRRHGSGEAGRLPSRSSAET